MTLYAVLLFLHLLAVVAAFSATAIIHFGLVRMRKAEHLAAARDALMLTERTGRAMPIVGAALLLTGALLTQTAWSWTTPWIDVSIAGLVAIMITGGGMLGRRVRALGPLLQRPADGPVDDALASSLRDPSLWTIAQLPPLLAIGVMFVMTTKPSLGVGVIEIVAITVLGLAVTMMSGARGAVVRQVSQ